MFINFFQKNTEKAITQYITTLILSAIIGLHFSDAQAANSSLTWVGDRLQSGNWSVANNWDGGDPNTTNYDATINRSGFRGVNLDKNFNVQTFNLNAGTLNTGTNILTVNETFNWTRGTLAGTGAIRAAGGLELGGNGLLAFKDSAVVINSTDQIANWNNGNFLMSFTGDSGFVNEIGALFIAKVDSGSMGLLSGRGKFDNHGAFVAGLTGADKVVTINTKMNNHGFVGTQIGELRLSGGGISTGSFVAGEQGKINFGGGVHELQASSSITGTNVEFGRFLGTTNIGGTYNVINTRISGGATANFNALESNTETLTLDGSGFSILGGSGSLVVANKTTFRNGVLQGPTSGTAPPALLFANGGLKLEGPGVKVIRGERILVAGGEDTSWDEGSIILANGRAEGSDISRGSVLFNNTVLTAKSVGGAIVGPGEVVNAGAFQVDLPELYEQIEGAPRNQILIKSNFTNQGVLALQGANLLIGGELEEENILNNTETNRFNGNFTQTETGITTIKIAGNDRGMEYDTLDVFKIAILDGAFFIKLVDDILLPDDSATVFIPEIGDFFDLVVAGEIIDNGFAFGGPHGQLFERSIVELADGRSAVRATFAPNLAAGFASIAADVSPIAASLVPIPSTLWLFMSALYGIWHIRIRQSR